MFVCGCVVRSYLPAQQLFCFGSSAATVHSQCCQRQLLLLRRFHTLNVRSSSVGKGGGRIICCHVVVIADSLHLFLCVVSKHSRADSKRTIDDK